ncbi:MAG TPA: SPOR domain-containing protein [Rudaea sp.]|nr:SPOR domain-containing protein [Rudaea sp.]
MAARHGKQAYRGNDRQSWPAWVWLGIGVLLGLTLSALVLIKDWAPMLRKKNLPQPNPEATAPKEPEQAVADEAGKKPAPPKKTFDFYSVLPEMEVVIPDAELSAKARAEQQRQQLAVAQAQAGNAANATSAPAATNATAAPAEPGARYVLLAGSYADPKAADEAKAKLALLGIVAKVQSITVNGKTFNRVMVGPYSNASETETAKKTLADSGIKAIPMKQAPNQ